MRCPSDNYANNWGGQHATSYRFNTGYSYGYGLGISDSYTVHPSYYLVWGRARDRQILRPGNTIILADAAAPGGYEYDIVNLGNVSRVANYHNGGANFLWTDGHASFMKTADVTPAMFDRRR